MFDPIQEEYRNHHFSLSPHIHLLLLLLHYRLNFTGQNILKSKASIMDPSMWTRSSSSISSSDADDDNIECGFSSSSSNDDVSLESSCSAGPQEMVIASSKMKNNGKIPRRLSQSSQLSFRRAKASLLPQTPTFSSTSTSSSPERKDLHHLIPSMFTFSLLTLLLFIITLFTFSQQHSKMESMRLQLDISNQHRTFLEKSASDLQAKVTSREGAMNHCRDAHMTLSKQHKEQRGTVRELEEEIAELRREIERLNSRDAEE